jgi:hypothetical protein
MEIFKKFLNRCVLIIAEDIMMGDLNIVCHDISVKVGS